MSLRSTDITFPLTIFSAKTWDQPPGEDPKSKTLSLAFSKENFVIISISLYADLDLYPLILDFIKKTSLL